MRAAPERKPRLLDFAPSEEGFREAVLDGLRARPKSLPCKFLYDEEGSRLFEAICELPEYYPTRTETALLERYAGEMAARIGPDCELIELGSGASRKVRLLLDALETPAAYLPVDIAREPLFAAAAAIARDYPDLAVTAVCADYSLGLDLPPRQKGRRRTAFFPGSTIGNLRPRAAQSFLAACARMLAGGGALIVGVDLKKAPEILHAAYNDAAGVTAAFNLNLLVRMNRELGGDFDLAAFRHHAFYNEAMGRIEIYIESRRDQLVRVAGTVIRFGEGERIHTEDSCKYSVAEFQSLARAAGFRPAAVWQDAASLFSIHYLEVD